MSQTENQTARQNMETPSEMTPEMETGTAPEMMPQATPETDPEARPEKALSFIVTSYNVRPYIGRCLTSLAACARPGDRVILVDDGSTDGTAEEIETLLAQSGFAPGVALQPILLGANTIGGVGIAGNTGLHAALSDPGCAAVFFVDGDDWLEPAGFQACRRAFEAGPADILLGNYTEYDEEGDSYRRPADATLWARRRQLPLGDPEAARRLALRMIAVPWRKFYRADFLRRHRLRFPEGRFFFEDNPFHWQVCLKAGPIAFHDRVLCQHRINRPGQTMASTGIELAAFFTHYDSIRAIIRANIHEAQQGEDDGLQAAALTWLLNNMSWHLERLRPAAFWPYADRAARTLAGVPEAIWQAVAPGFAAKAVGPIAAALRRGEVAGVVAVWMQQLQAQEIAALQERVEALADSLPGLGAGLMDGLRPPLDHSNAQITALREILRFQALTALPGGAPAPLQIGDDSRD